MPAGTRYAHYLSGISKYPFGAMETMESILWPLIETDPDVQNTPSQTVGEAKYPLKEQLHPK